MTSGSLFVLVGLPRRMHDLLGRGRSTIPRNGLFSAKRP